MLIGLEKRFVFVANTKTASSAIERLLAPHADYRHSGSPRRKHMPLAQAEREIAHIFSDPACPFDSFFRFGVMREPLDWIRSWFRYRKRPGARNPLPDDMSFREFWAMQDWNFVSRKGVRNLQRNRFCGDDGALLADVILPYHRLEEGLARVLGLLEIAYSALPRVNVSPPPEGEDGIDPALAAELRTFYAEDYALFERLDAINEAGLARLAARMAARSGG